MIDKIGWTSTLESAWNEMNREHWIKGRVCTQSRELFKVITEQGEWLCSLPGVFNYDPSFDFPAVGDWVAVEQLPGEQRGIIRDVLKRQSVFERKTAGIEIKAQVIAANIDYAFLVMSCNDDFNIRRLERYLIASWDSGAQPVIVLTKSDLIEDSKRLKLELEVERIAYGVPLHFVSNETGENIDVLQETLKPNFTGALLGSSGVGKSTLVNSLLRTEKMKTNSIREDDSKGKHTTTYRQLIVLPEGGILIDTPGMREFQLWSKEENEGLSESFNDVTALFSSCKFSDCQHKSEPDCAVKEALISGTLSQDRYDSYFKLQKELAYIEKKENEKRMRQEKEKRKSLSVMSKKRGK